MTTTLFESISHADFLRLTLEAFARQGFTVEQSRDAGADAVLVGKNGIRVGLLCKKYRGAFIGRPVLQQFTAAMRQLRCKEGYLVTTTDCSPDACAFAVGKGVVLYNGAKTTEFLRTAFGDELIGRGTMPELGKTAKTAPPAARQTASPASYEKVALAGKETGSAKAAEPVQSPAQTPEPVQARVAVHAPEPVPKPVQAAEPEHSAGPEQAPQERAVVEELPEVVQEVQELQDEPERKGEQSDHSPGIPEAAPSEKTTVIVCLECNRQMQVPIDQGMITVQCPECGTRRVYQPELNEAGELQTATVITCKSCSQKLNVPTNRGQLNVRCPKCRAAWVFTP